MIARLTSDKLWTRWNDIPSTVIIPDEGDGKRFYGMPTFYYGGIYWGFLQQYTDDPAAIDIELMTSRDGIDLRPVAGIKKILPFQTFLEYSLEKQFQTQYQVMMHISWNVILMT